MRKHSHDGERLAYRSGGRGFILFGLPFAAAGLVMLYSVATRADTSWADRIVFGLLGLVFVALGLLFILGRAGLVLDRPAGRATEWWGPLRPMWRTEHPLRAFDRVVISHELRRSRSGGPYDAYPVRLVGPAAELRIDTPVKLVAAERIAGEVAQFLGLKLEGLASRRSSVV